MRHVCCMGGVRLFQKANYAFSTLEIGCGLSGCGLWKDYNSSWKVACQQVRCDNIGRFRSSPPSPPLTDLQPSSLILNPCPLITPAVLLSMSELMTVFEPTGHPQALQWKKKSVFCGGVEERQIKKEEGKWLEEVEGGEGDLGQEKQKGQSGKKAEHEA